MWKHRVYDWRNIKTGQIVTTDTADTPPDDSGQWVRVYQVGIAKVSGAGSSPARSSYIKEKK
ncbi:MAG: hypothetical protein QXY15_10135 [Candidatus Nitrosotenuis sp.]